MSYLDESDPSMSPEDSMSQPMASSFSVDSQGAVHLAHKVRKWLKVDGDASPHVRPTAPFANVVFHARINAEVYDQRAANQTTGVNTRLHPLVDTFPVDVSSPSNGAASATAAGAGAGAKRPTSPVKEKPIEAILGVTKLFRGLEIALRSMVVGEHSDFSVPPEMGHYFGSGNDLPLKCPLHMDIKLLSCDNFHAIPRLPGCDYEPYKWTRTEGSTDKEKRIFLGSTVDFFHNKPDDRTGQMSAPKRQTIVVGSNAVGPIVDMLLMSMCEREIATFAMARGDGVPAFEFNVTVVGVKPPAIGVGISSAHIMGVYTGGNDPGSDSDEYKAPIDLEGPGADAVDRAIKTLQETARDVYQDNKLIAVWHFAAASAIVRQRGGSMAEVNKALARLTTSMARCALRLNLAGEARHLAREAYSFDSGYAVGVFMLAQALKECGDFQEALKMLDQCEQMDHANADEIAEERESVEELIMQQLAREDGTSASSSQATSSQATPKK